jgi:hypothetical protein
MAPLVLTNRRETHADSARQQLAQILRHFIQSRGGWITSPLPLADTVALRFDVRSHNAAQISRELGALGLAVRFVGAGLQTGPSSVTELIREGHRIVGGRRMPAPCAVTTFEIALPDKKMAAPSEREIILECASTAQAVPNSGRRTAGACTETTIIAPTRRSRPKMPNRQPTAQNRRDTTPAISRT